MGAQVARQALQRQAGRKVRQGLQFFDPDIHVVHIIPVKIGMHGSTPWGPGGRKHIQEEKGSV